MSHLPVAERLLLASTSLFLLAAPFTASPGWRAALLIASAGLVASLVARGRLAIPRPLPGALLVAMGATSALAVASLAWSTDPGYSVSELRRQLLYAGLAFTAFYLAASPERWHAWRNTMLAGALLLVLAEALRAALSPRLGTRAWDGGAGSLSTHLVILGPLLLPFAWSEREGERPRTVAFVAAMLLLFAAAWATENRVVWAALLVAFATAAAARHWAGDARPRLTGLRPLAIALAALMLALATLSLYHRGAENPATRHSAVAGLDSDLRPRIWSAARERIAQAPLLGHGFGRDIASDAFRALTPAGHPEILHAHNLFANVALQLGLAGLALFAAVLLLLALEFARGLRARQTSPAAIIGLAMLAGFIAKNLTDDFLYRHNGLVFWAAMGMLLGLARRRTPP